MGVTSHSKRGKQLSLDRETTKGKDLNVGVFSMLKKEEKEV